MAMNHRPGGGPASNKITERPVRTGTGSKGISPGWVGQKGQMQGDHVTREGSTGYRGEQKFTGQNFGPVPFGNQVALNVKGGGPGTGRTLYGQSGSQGTHGSVNPGNPRPVPSGHIIESYGPTIPGRK